MQHHQITQLGAGSYVLICYVKRTTPISVGKLGTRSFPAGYYTYVGSARGPGGLSARLKHHIHTSAAPHWHVDYLRPTALLVEIWLSEGQEQLEHRWAAILERLNRAARPIRGFGSSDCRCPSHLFHFPQKPSYRHFKTTVDGKLKMNKQLRRMLTT